MLVVLGGFEDLLHVSAHVECFQHLVTFVEDKVLDVLEVQVLFPDESEDSAWRPNNNLRLNSNCFANLRRVVLDSFEIELQRDTAVEDCN